MHLETPIVMLPRTKNMLESSLQYKHTQPLTSHQDAAISAESCASHWPIIMKVLMRCKKLVLIIGGKSEALIREAPGNILVIYRWPKNPVGTRNIQLVLEHNQLGNF